MNFIHPKICDSILGAGNLPGVADLPVHRTIIEDTIPITHSYWRPSPEELIDLCNGGAVRLSIFGLSHAPVMVTTCNAATAEEK